MTLVEAASKYGIPYTTLVTAAQRGWLSASQIRGYWYVEDEAVQKYLKLYRPRGIFQRRQNGLR